LRREVESPLEKKLPFFFIVAVIRGPLYGPGVSNMMKNLLFRRAGVRETKTGDFPIALKLFCQFFHALPPAMLSPGEPQCKLHP
jgi:hypothetical protein